MDQLQFYPANTTNTDTSLETEGYADQVEEIQQAYPEQDWRTPAEIEAENQAEMQQASDDAFNPGSVAQEQPLNVAQQPEVTTEQPELVEPEVVEPLPEIGPNRFAEYVDPETGMIPIDVLRAAGVDENIIKSMNIEHDLNDEERQLWDDFDKNGGHRNI